MSLVLTSKDGGDLGSPEVTFTSLPDFATRVQTVAKALPVLKSVLDAFGLRPAQEILSFGFRLPHTATEKEFIAYVKNIKLTEGVEWYEIDGKSLFEMRGPSGGVVTSYACYLICK